MANAQELEINIRNVSVILWCRLCYQCQTWSLRSKREILQCVRWDVWRWGDLSAYGANPWQEGNLSPMPLITKSTFRPLYPNDARPNSNGNEVSRYHSIYKKNTTIRLYHFQSKCPGIEHKYSSDYYYSLKQCGGSPCEKVVKVLTADNWNSTKIVSYWVSFDFGEQIDVLWCSVRAVGRLRKGRDVFLCQKLPQSRMCDSVMVENSYFGNIKDAIIKPLCS